MGKWERMSIGGENMLSGFRSFPIFYFLFRTFSVFDKKAEL
jgi:hypothetical protein